MNPRELQEAFYAISIAQDMPDAKLLDDVIRRYPQFRKELTEFAIAIAVDMLRGDHEIEATEDAIDPNTVSPAVSRAMSHFQNRLYAVTAEATKTKGRHANITDAANPFLSLRRDEFRAVASRLNANSVFICKLRDRQIDPATITTGFQARMAEELKVPPEVLMAHFTAPQTAPTTQFFNAEGKPFAGGQQSFEEAVKSSGLSEDQQKFLLKL
ncbi:MAG: hypothetical protein WBB23_08340 [Desulforhopalus sp.]